MSHDLDRFVQAQNAVYAGVLAELRAGRKRSHWMWYVFPQIAGLGRTPTSILYAIADRSEARAYVAHPVLGPRLEECTKLVLEGTESDPFEIFGHPDDMKFRSSMTLFGACVAEPDLFRQALDRFFGGEPDALTLKILAP